MGRDRRFDTPARIWPDEPATLDRYDRSGVGCHILGEQGSGSFHVQIDSKPRSDGDELDRIALLADRTIYDLDRADMPDSALTHQHAQIRMPPRVAETLAVILLAQAAQLTDRWDEHGVDIDTWGAKLRHLLEDPAVAEILDELARRRR